MTSAQNELGCYHLLIGQTLDNLIYVVKVFIPPRLNLVITCADLLLLFYDAMSLTSSQLLTKHFNDNVVPL